MSADGSAALNGMQIGPFDIDAVGGAGASAGIDAEGALSVSGLISGSADATATAEGTATLSGSGQGTGSLTANITGNVEGTGQINGAGDFNILDVDTTAEIPDTPLSLIGIGVGVFSCIVGFASWIGAEVMQITNHLRRQSNMREERPDFEQQQNTHQALMDAIQSLNNRLERMEKAQQGIQEELFGDGRPNFDQQQNTHQALEDTNQFLNVRLAQMEEAQQRTLDVLSQQLLVLREPNVIDLRNAKKV